MPELTGGQALVRALVANGVDTIFALPGVQLDGFFNALHDERERIRVITPRHELGAGYMALGYALASGKVGTYAVVPGPGLLNTFAALATAWSSNARVLCIAGQIPAAFIGKGLGMLHEIPDQLAMTRQLTKWAERIDHPSEVPAKVAEAFRQLWTGRPRPVGLEMAMDRLMASGSVTPIPAAAHRLGPEPDSATIKAAAAMLGAARKPLIVVGGGALHASEELRALAEALEAPVSAHWMGRGALSDEHYLSVTDPLGRRLWPESDVVLSVGTRLVHQRRMWAGLAGQKVIQINLDPEDMARIQEPDIAIEADSRAALQSLLAELPRHNHKRPSRKDELLGLKLEMERMYETRLGPQMAYLKAIRRALDPDGIFVDELTQVGYVSRFAYPVLRPGTYLMPSNQGTLGWGFATALGVKVAQPRRQVLSINGDGGFLYTANELATAVQYGINVVAVVFNDRAYGNVKRMQIENYGGRVIGSDLHNPDFVRFAESFGAAGYRAETPERLTEVLAEAFQQNGPVLIDAPVGAMPDPWEIMWGQNLDSVMRGEKK